MTSPSPHQPPNAKRYWGEEKNIDSIYSIYLKKICYSYNNDLSLATNYIRQDERRGSLNESQHSTNSTVSSNDPSKQAHKLAGGNYSGSYSGKRTFNSSNNDSNCQQKPEESPRGRRNFFQKYRRRSCSMDKYSIEKHHKACSSTPQNIAKSNSTKSSSKTMRFSSKKSSQLADNNLSFSHDELDGEGLTAHTKSNQDKRASNGFATTGRLHHSKQEQTLSVNESHTHHKSTNDLSVQAPTQSLQWETRQIKILQAATLDHVLKFILLINSPKDLNNLNPNSSPTVGDNSLEEERNNVAHIIHVFFCTYRIYTNPHELMLKLMDYSDICRIEQYRFVMHYWMDNYPEDFNYLVEFPETNNSITSGESGNNNQRHEASTGGHLVNSYNNSITSYDSSTTSTARMAATSDSENSIGIGLDGTMKSSPGGSRSGSEHLDRRLSNLSIKTTSINQTAEKSGVPLVNELLRLCRDEYIRGKVVKLNELKLVATSGAGSTTNETTSESGRKSSRLTTTSSHKGTKNSAVLDLDSRYVAQQLTAIDLENFLSLRPYSLLEGTKSDKRIQSMIKNFNLLSRHVVVTILKSHQPNIVAAHWIAIAMNLRKIKNFNSLKAIIAGLTNESIYRLKQLVWTKLDRNSLANFKLMASIVDDVNNQIVLRQTQLVVEGTAKMSIEDDSFGTIPYLGTFLTDLNMIDARYPSHVPSPKDETSKLKLINFEKCAKQFEILTQVQLLQKNVLASLHAIQRRNHFDEQTTLNRLKLEFNQNHQMLLAKPAIPQVARLFENWFYDETVSSMTDKQW